MRKFGQYIVYVDESGDHGLNTIDAGYPMFVLAFCIFHKEQYIRLAIPRLQALKFTHFGHDMIILHEHEIRKSKGAFRFLLNRDAREAFMLDLNAMISDIPFTIIASCIRKQDFVDHRGNAVNPYHAALEYGLERVYLFLRDREQHHAVTHIVFERRGRNEDRELEQEFRRICDKSYFDGLGAALRMIMASKESNSCGLQLADLVARPIGRYLLDPEQPNRAFALLEPKIRRGPDGEIRGWGLTCYP